MMIPNTYSNGFHPERNLSCVLIAPAKISVKDLVTPAVGPNDVKIRVMATGICGSDTHMYDHGRVGPIVLTEPAVMGHESAGEVVEVGKNVKSVLIGDRVAIEPGKPCYKCFNCSRGRTNICLNLKHAGMPPTHGSLSQYYVCPAELTVPLSGRIQWAEAGCIQPLAVAVQLARRGGLSAGQTLCVFGCGPLGLLVMAVARAYGVSRIMAFDIIQQRVDFAKAYVADYAALAPQKTGDQDYGVWAEEWKANAMKEAGIASMGVDVVVEASGAEPCMHAGVSFLHPGGTYIQAGLGRPINSFPALSLVAKELTMVGTIRYTPGCFATAIDLVARGIINLKPLITATFPIDRIEDAFTAVKSGKNIKVVVMNSETSD